MADGRQVIRIEQMLDTVHKADSLFKLKDLFTYMQSQITVDQTDLIQENMPVGQQIRDLAIGTSNFFMELDKKIRYINTAQVEGALCEKLGSVFLEKLNSEIQSDHISIAEAYFLTNIAYFRVERHFDHGGVYHPEHIGKDNSLFLLPEQYSNLKKQMIIPGARPFLSEQLERLELFLMYMQLADLDFDVTELSEVYQRFEEEMAFCQTIPEKFQNIYHIKQTGFSGSWATYKRFEKDKESEHYKWINTLQEFEKTHPYIGTAIQIYIMDYNRKKIIDKTKPFEFEKKDTS